MVPYAASPPSPPTPCPRRHYTQVPMPSVTVPVDPGGHYEGLPYFETFGDRISFVGGINRPKVGPAGRPVAIIH